MPHLRSLPFIERLLAFDTTSYRSNLDCIAFIAESLEALGATIRLTHDSTRQKANLFATLGPEDRPGVVLSGHTDVVPVTHQAWDSPPFQAVYREDRLYARGSADMKSFIGICLALAPEFAAERLAMPLHFAFSYDEEVGCVGVRSLIDDLEHRPVRPRLCIVGEPTCMTPVIGHKGKKSIRCHVHGKGGHSALNHLGVNAIEVAAEIVAHLRSLQRDLSENGPFDPEYTPPTTTIHTGTFQGGTALNIIPNACDFEFEIRNLPAHDVEALMGEIRSFAQDLLPRMHAVAPESGIVFDEHNTTPGLDTGRDTPEALLVRRLCHGEDTKKVSFTTEAGLFQGIHIPTVVCGPGDITQAHKPNEFIALEQIARAETFVRGLLRWMLS